MSVRDRRWAQGNLQHSRVMFAPGLKWPSRQHFATGIMGYMASPLADAARRPPSALVLQ